jgi:hypothetical protein
LCAGNIDVPLTDGGDVQWHEYEQHRHDLRWQVEYSGGARQTTMRLFQHRPGYLLLPTSSGYDTTLLLETSKFCLAPQGWGWRLKKSLVHGCVPVIVQVGHGGGRGSRLMLLRLLLP